VIPGYQPIARPGRWPGRHRPQQAANSGLLSVPPCLRFWKLFPFPPSPPSPLSLFPPLTKFWPTADCRVLPAT